MAQARWWCLIFSLWAACPSVASAEGVNLFSPGPLSVVHQKLEGPGNCTRCHAAGGQVSMAKCYECHTDVKQSVANKTGLHGHVSPDRLNCDNCHHEHLGASNTLMPWRPDRSDFNHAATGWPLRGAHAKVACETCHTAHYASGYVDYSGLRSACVSCHFDEHRGQEKGTCDRCHNQTFWAPAPYFQHDVDSSYALTGKHRIVPCKQCHPTVEDMTASSHAKPAPLKRSYLKYTGIPHDACIDCHKDPHNGERGQRCGQCHTTQSWLTMAHEAKDTGFHAETRFPLKGMHADVACKKCHGPWGNQPAVFKNLRFNECEDCHVDAHEGQIEFSPKHRAPPCQNCHTVESFSPPEFDVDDHKKTKYPLEGAHAATPCQLCHAKKDALLRAVTKDIRERLFHEGRDLLASVAELAIDRNVQRCESCHGSPHAGQFYLQHKSGCVDCHTMQSFHELNFDHNKDSRFVLTGAHATAACGSCHTPQLFGDTVATLYRPMNTACSACHQDVHEGQFANPGDVTHCERCHDTNTFKKANTFNHDDAKQARFPLEGAHAQLKCSTCHGVVALDKNTDVVRYKPLPTTCNGCHEDYHAGKLDNVPLPDGRDGTAAPAGPACERCHLANAWLPADFAEHDRTAYPLNGGHRDAACLACHTRDFKAPVSTMCEACHRDPHVGEFGTQCEACHSESNWAPKFDVDAHRLTNFPLVGAHGALPCQECHQGYFNRNFRGTSVLCITCHQQDYLRTALVSINHVASGFSYNCRECHDPWAFQRGVLPDHSRCFQIYVGVHNGITCLDCHTSLVGAVDNGACATGTPACTGCHIHSQAATDPLHKGVNGYVYNSLACYPCHKTVQ